MKQIMIIVLFTVLGVLFYFSKEAQIVLGGVALFFLGMMMLEEGMKSFVGGALENILTKATNSQLKSLFTGFITTAVVQSSSLVSLIAISFLSAGLIKLSAGIGIVFGSNLGTTATAWLVSFFGLKIKISSYALALATFGMTFNIVGKNSLKGLSNILVGLAILLLAIGFMKDGFEAVKDQIDLLQFAMGGYLGLFVFIGVGIIATIVMQSSSATMALVLTALATGQINFENSLALAIGANIGTTITAILGALTSNAAGKRLAVAHLMFNVVTGILAVAFLPLLVDAVEFTAALMSISDLAMKLSLFHTIFNFLGILVMAPLMTILVKWLETLFIEKKSNYATPKYLNSTLLEYPTASLTAIKSELIHLYENAFIILAHSVHLHSKEIISQEDMHAIVNKPCDLISQDVAQEYQSYIKTLYSDILEFSTKAQVFMNNEDELKKVNYLKLATRYIAEAVKKSDDIKTNMDKFLLSRNEHIKKEYNLLRANLGKLLREVEAIRINPKDSANLSKFTVMYKELEKSDTLINGTVDRLIRDNLITASMGTSLINDSAFLYEIGMLIIQATEILFINENEELKIAYQTLKEENFKEIHYGQKNR